MPRLTHPGSRARNAEQWQRLVRLYRDSSLSQRAFCAEQGLALSTFTRWCRRLGHLPDSDVGADPVLEPVGGGFVAVRVAPTARAPAAHRSTALSVVLPGGARIENITATDVAVVAALVSAL